MAGNARKKFLGLVRVHEAVGSNPATRTKNPLKSVISEDFLLLFFNFDPLSDPLTDERSRTIWKHWTPPYIAISMKFPIFSAACSCIRSVTWV